MIYKQFGLTNNVGVLNDERVEGLKLRLSLVPWWWKKLRNPIFKETTWVYFKCFMIFLDQSLKKDNIAWFCPVNEEK